MNLSDLEKLLPSDEEEQEFVDYYKPLYTTNREERDWIRTEGLADYLKMRRRYGNVILCLTFLWITAVLVVVFMQGYRQMDLLFLTLYLCCYSVQQRQMLLGFLLLSPTTCFLKMRETCLTFLQRVTTTNLVPGRGGLLLTP